LNISISGNDSDQIISLIDANGKIVTTKIAEKNSVNKVALDNIAAGVYTVSVKGQKSSGAKVVTIGNK
jgi:hypothetical protein